MPGHVYMDACDACVVYMCLSTCLSGIHAQPHCRLVAWGYNNLASDGLQDSAASDSSNACFGPSGFKSSFNGACSSSWAAMALCCDAMCGNLVECLNSESNSNFSRNTVSYRALLSACPLTVTVSESHLTIPLKIHFND